MFQRESRVVSINRGVRQLVNSLKIQVDDINIVVEDNASASLQKFSVNSLKIQSDDVNTAELLKIMSLCVSFQNNLKRICTNYFKLQIFWKRSVQK